MPNNAPTAPNTPAAPTVAAGSRKRRPGLNRAVYRTYRKWIQEQLLQHAYNPLAMYEVMVESAEGGDENYEASQAAKDELAFYLLCVEKTGEWPYLNYVPGHREQVGRDIAELKRRLAAVPA